MSARWTLVSCALWVCIALVSCDSLVDDDGQCGKYKISCPLGKICRVRKIYWPRKVQYPICVLRDTPAENRNTCRLPPAPGTCVGRFLRWFYNTHSGQCSFFYYSGCKGNDNNFLRREDCESTCLGLRALVIPPEATVLPPVDPLNVPSERLSNLQLVEAPTVVGLPNGSDRKPGRGRKGKKDKRRKGKRRRNRPHRRPRKYHSLNSAKVTFVPAQKDAPNRTKALVDKERNRVLPTSLRKSIASGKYFRIFTILSRRHGNNVYRSNRSHRRRKHRGRSTTPIPTVSPPTTPVL